MKESTEDLIYIFLTAFFGAILPLILMYFNFN